MSKLPTTRKKNKTPIENFNKVSTTERQWMVLSMVQRSKWIGTVYIQEQLKLAGFHVSLRTVQRDLVALSERFLIEHNNSNPQGWRWQEDAPLQSMPSMNLSQAVAFRMVQENLTQLLPPAILKELHPWFELADRQLKEENSMQSWLDKIHIEPPTLSLIPPEINTQVQNNIYQAVFEQKKLQASYTSNTATEETDYLLNPLALVQRGAIIYLLATKATQPSSTNDTDDNSLADSNNTNKLDTSNISADDNDANIRMFSLHRFNKVEILDEKSATPEDFSLAKYIDSGAMGFHEQRFDDLANKGKNTQISLTFTMQAYRTLNESKLSEDQLITLNSTDSTLTEPKLAESFTVTATVNLTRQLVWWLRGFGKTLLNAEPKRLWQVIQDETYQADEAEFKSP